MYDFLMYLMQSIAGRVTICLILFSSISVLCVLGFSIYFLSRFIRRAVNKERQAAQTNNSAMDAIAALADKWCDSTNQPDSVCVALYQFTQWARQQHQ